MTRLRAVLLASAIASLIGLLFSGTENAAAASTDDQTRGIRAHTRGPAQASILKASKRRAAKRPAATEGVLLKDLTTGQTLFEQRADQPMSPASLTKIMTAIVILEEADLEDQVTVSRHAAAARRMKLHLKPGQVLPLRGLLEAMLIRSANDACLAAAEHVGGDEDSFVTKMNAKAQAMGLTSTHFRNACGFDMDEHVSTARDLATLTEYAMANATFAAIVKEPAVVIRTIDSRRTFIARTTNRLLGVIDGAVGVKTGYTRKAGRCLIAVVRKEDKELLLVLLNTRQRWRTAHDLIHYGLRAQASPLNTASR